MNMTMINQADYLPPFNTVLDPKPDEALASLVHRMAEKNYCSVRDLLNIVGVENRKCLAADTLQFGVAPIQQLARRFSLPEAELTDMQTLPQNTKKFNRVRAYQLGKTVLPVQLVRRSTSACCPLCLKEHGYAKKSWDSVLVSSCEEHNVLLETKCPSCKKEFTWHRNSLNSIQCSCGECIDLSELSPRKVAPLPALLSMSSRDAITMATLMSLLLYPHQDEVSCRLLRHEDTANLHVVQSDVMAAMSGGTPAIYDLLKQQWLPKRMALGGQLGIDWILLPLAQSWGRELNKLRENVYQHLKKNSTDLSWVGAGLPDMVSTNSLIKLLNCTRHQLGTLVVRNQLQCENGRGQIPSGYTGESVLAYFNAESGNVTQQFDFFTDTTSVNYRHERLTKYPTRWKVSQGVVENEEMSVDEAAKYCGIYRMAIYGLLNRSSLLPSTRNGGRFVILKSSLDALKQEYVHSRELGARLNTNVTRLVDYLKAMNIEPVTGPSIDGGIIYFFSRKQTDHLTLEAVMAHGNQKLKCGRRTKSELQDDPQMSLTLSHVCAVLDCPTVTGTRLMRKYFFEKVGSEKGRNTLINETSFVSYLKSYRFNDGCIPIDIAAATLGITTKQFCSRWVNYGWVHLMNDGLRSYVLDYELRWIEHVTEITYSAAEGGKLLNCERYALNNLRSMATLQPFSVPGMERVRSYRYDIEVIRQLQDVPSH